MLGNDYGTMRLHGNQQNICIDDVVVALRGQFEQQLIDNPIFIGEQLIRLGQSTTGFGGKRFWFICPLCFARVAKLYFCDSVFACRHCQSIKYRTSRFKGMVEGQTFKTE